MKNEMHEAMPPMELPVPEIKSRQVPEHSSDKTPTTEIVGVKTTELPHPGSSTLPPLQKTVLPNVDPEAHAAGPSQPVATQHHPAIADDNDLIEKEWVQKAKAIVAKSKEDPYVQNKEMSKYKADYVKKRFNRELKISDT